MADLIRNDWKENLVNHDFVSCVRLRALSSRLNQQGFFSNLVINSFSTMGYLGEGTLECHHILCSFDHFSILSVGVG